MALSVFIQTNNKQLMGAKVAAHAIRRATRTPEAFDIHLMRVEEHPALVGRAGQLYLREGTKRAWTNDDLQSFTPTRFLPPSLMGFTGRAVVIDPDVFACVDVMELFSMDMGNKTIYCRRITPADGRPGYWATSVMLLDCAKLRHWQWDRCIDEMFAFTRDYRDWMSLSLEPADSIGTLGDEWNHYDVLNDQTKMVHMTGRLTQPWKTGLPVDFTQDKQPDVGPVGLQIRQLVRRVKCALKGVRFYPDGVYQPHPDKGQQQFFFTLLKECVELGVVSRDELELEMRAQHLRPDTLECLAAV